jgi:hypothetical protein
MSSMDTGGTKRHQSKSALQHSYYNTKKII